MAEAFKFPDEPGAPGATEDQLEISVAGEETTPELEIVDDTPPEDRGRRPLDREVADPTEEELKEYSDKVQKRIKELTHARHDDRRRADALQREREELERVARTAIGEVTTLRKQLAAGGEVYATTLKTSATTELEMARKALKEAHEAFDTDAIVAAQEKLNSAQMRMQDAERFVPPVAQPAEFDVPSGQQTNIPKPDTKALSWQAKNQWYGVEGFEAETAFALGLHQKLAREHGPQFIGSDEYYSALDGRLRDTFPKMFGRTAAASGQGRPSTIVAPVTRVTGGRQKITLTQTQVATAKRLGITPQQYAMEVLKINQQMKDA
jgi:hypothetical protein